MTYLEDILSLIETPMLTKSYFCFFNQLVFDTPIIGHFICHMETFTTFHRACMEFFSWAVVVTLLGQEVMADDNRETLRLEISCKPLDWQLSALAQVLNSFLYSLLALEAVKIAVSCEDWQGEIEVIQWQEFLQLFIFAKKVTLVHKDSVWLVVPALQELARERATEVLPALQNLFLWTYGWQPSGPLKEAIGQLITTQQLHSHSLTVQYWDNNSRKYI